MVLSPCEHLFEGKMFSNPEDPEKIMAHIPTTYNNNHASTLIELENGDLLCTWFAGLVEGSPDIKIVYSRLKKGSDTWEYPQLLSGDYTRSEQNPVFFQEPGGRLRVLHTAQDSRGKMFQEEWEEMRDRGEVQGEFTMQETSKILCRFSEDNGYTWSPTTTAFGKPGAFCRHSIKILSNGDWVFPMWYSVGGTARGNQYGNDYSVVQVSSDCGETWTEYEVPGSKRRVHMDIVELKPGHCAAFFRSRSADWVYRSDSHDFGRTWSVPSPTVLPNNNGSVQAIKLQSGRLAIILNHYQGGVNPDETVWPGLRYSIDVAISEDDGNTFPYMRTVEFGDGFKGKSHAKRNRMCEYPCIIQGRDGKIHIAYSYHSRKYIKYVSVTEEYLLGFV